MRRSPSIVSILETQALVTPTANALYAPERKPASYSDVFSHIRRTAHEIRRTGLRRSDTIAVVLPNGPEMATAFLSISAAAVCAPLNPAYRAEEFDFYLADLPARALAIAGLPDCAARDAARRAGIPIIELEWSSDDPAGIFRLQNGNADAGVDDLDYPEETDVALVLHTSGTTSRPKIVPLTHGNLAASARHVAGVLELTPNDICLNVMPLFHIHGLVAALLASLNSGAGVVCTPGFLAPSFLDWMMQFEPTWYTAVPTIHASVANRAEANQSAVESHTLRFIRSSSAALPAATLQRLERIFRVPVIEAYGMTEAAHQMASNPLPPMIRKPGTVGCAAGPAIRVIDHAGQSVAAGKRGEVAIKGPNVTSGYLRNPAANEAAFTDGWLRTGDEGVLDNDGYLTILGRIKEMINRGGEKVSPLEVDDVLLAHPAVAHAITFAASDAMLGEEVAAAVVLRDGATITERQLREFASARLAWFKVPRRILFMDAIPTGPTGKPQRIGLGGKLGVSFDAPQAASVDYVPPRTPVEEIVAHVWSSVMDSKSPGIHDNFFFAGGDSILAARIVTRLREALAVEVSLLSFFDEPTVAGIASAIEDTMSREPAA